MLAVHRGAAIDALTPVDCNDDILPSQDAGSGDRRSRVEFEAGDPSAEWATEYSRWPEDRYVHIPGLAATPDAKHEEILSYAASLVRSLPGTRLKGVKGAAA